MTQIGNMDRKTRLLAQLTELTADLSGYGEEELAPGSSFLELGFDSLFMTQLATSFSREMGVPVTFRQLFDEVPSLEALAAYMDAALPKEAPIASEPVREEPEPQTQPQAVPQTEIPSQLQMPSPQPVQGSSGLAGILAEQVKLMSEQLRVLQQIRAGATTVPAVATTAALTKTDPPAVSAQPAQRQIEEKPAITMPKGFGPDVSGADKSCSYTPRQLGGVRRLIERYNAKTAGSKLRTQEDRAVHADPRTAAGFNALWKEMVYPIVVERSRGAYLWDVDGNKYIDILNGFGPNFFGHNAPFVTEALMGQLQNSYEVGPQTPKAGEAARLLCELTGMDRVSWVNTGSEAVQAAIRISRTVTGRDKIVVFAGDYHGNFDEVLVRSTKGPKGRRTFPQAPGIPFESVGNVIVLDYGEMDSLDEIRAQAGDIAAVLVEPVQSRRPELQPAEFLKELRQLTADEGIVLVFDEVITGFRIRQGGAQEYFGIEADLATYGKIIGGGMPIGVVAGRSKFMDTFDGGMWQYGDASRPTAGVTFFAGTFVRHPLAITAAFASLNYLKNAGPALQEGINRRANKMATGLSTFFQEEGINIEVPQFASQMFIRNKEESELATLLFYHMRDRGIHVLEGFPSYMTAAHTDEDVETIIDAVKDGVYEMQADHLLPSRADGGSAPFRREFDLTDDQRHMWLASQMSAEASCAFNESDRVDIEGALDRDSFLLAVQETLKAHEAFHIRFDPEGERQWVDETARFDIEETDLSAISGAARNEALEECLKNAATTPFDLEQGPLFRAILVKLAEEHHVLVIYCHHLVFDGYSAGLVIREIMGRYKSGVSGEVFTPTETVPYSAYAARMSGKTKKTTAAADYWQACYEDGVPPLADLPVDALRKPERAYNGATLETPMAPALASAITQAARTLKISKQMLLFSAFSILVSRLSRSEDFVIGMPAAGQAAEELETVGYCVNMMPLRVQPESGKALPGYVEEIRDHLLGAFEHQNFSVTDLVNGTDVPRAAGRLPLTEIIFNYSRFMSDIEVPGLKIAAGENERYAVFYDLFFQVIETEEESTICVDYSAGLFEKETVKNWINQYTSLLEDICANPSKTLGDFTFGKGGQSVLQGPARTIDPAETALDLVSAMVKAAPASKAVTFQGESLTYAELEDEANRLASVLAKRGVKPGDITGILMERSPDILVSILAIWKTGSAFLPLDPEFPEERLKYMVEDAGAHLVLSDAETAHRLPVTGNFLILDETEIPSGDVPAMPLNDATSQGGTRAYVLYTSGSTGKPKGVENTHGALVNFLKAMKDRPGISAEDRLLALTTMSFDISILELILPLTVGAEIILASRDEAMDGYDLADLAEDHDATIMQATPVTWQLMLDCGWQGKQDMKALCGGEALPSALASELLPVVSELWNMYGPTETTIWSSCELISDPDRVTVGTPVLNTGFYVLDEDNTPLPKGVPGTLWIGGAGVASGYLGRPDQTEQRFHTDPFDGGRMYNTGDRALIRPDGKVKILGRIDNQVKVRGHRIELGEVESVLVNHPSVAQAAAAVHLNSHGEHVLTGYVVWQGDDVTHSELRQWLRQSVPDYMIPQAFVALEIMPLTSNRKIDRKALPEPHPAEAQARHHVAPRSETEKLIASLWAEMLDIEDISVTDNFFELGGQSLQVVRITSILRKHHGISLAPRAVIFETLEQLAATAERLAS